MVEVDMDLGLIMVMIGFQKLFKRLLDFLYKNKVIRLKPNLIIHYPFQI